MSAAAGRPVGSVTVSKQTLLSCHPPPTSRLTTGSVVCGEGGKARWSRWGGRPRPCLASFWVEGRFVRGSDASFHRNLARLGKGPPRVSSLLDRRCCDVRLGVPGQCGPSRGPRQAPRARGGVLPLEHLPLVPLPTEPACGDPGPGIRGGPRTSERAPGPSEPPRGRQGRISGDLGWSR